MRFRVLFPAALLCFLASLASAATVINTELVFSGERAAQVDPTTGRVYVNSGYAPSSFGFFGSIADFETGTNFTALSLSGGAPYGTYYGAKDGFIFARPDSSSNVIAKYDGTTGALIASRAIPDYCGSNYNCGFDWGGYSSMNLLQDQTGMYLLGRTSPTGQWILSSIDSQLNTSEIARFASTASNDGYGIMMHGTLFLGQSYNSTLITMAYDIGSNQFFNPDLQLEGPNGCSYAYRRSTFYDVASDALYINDVGCSGTLRVQNASAEFGVAAPSPVPLPAGALLLVTGLAVFCAARRRRSA